MSTRLFGSSVRISFGIRHGLLSLLLLLFSGLATADGSLSGSWYNPDRNGEGFHIEILEDDKALVIWFTYDGAGKQSWMLNIGSIDGGTVTISDLQRPVGGIFGRRFVPEKVARPLWGELTLDLTCSGGTARYTTQAKGFASGEQSLVPLTQLANSGCSN